MTSLGLWYLPRKTSRCGATRWNLFLDISKVFPRCSTGVLAMFRSCFQVSTAFSASLLHRPNFQTSPSKPVRGCKGIPRRETANSSPIVCPAQTEINPPAGCEGSRGCARRVARQLNSASRQKEQELWASRADSPRLRPGVRIGPPFLLVPVDGAQRLITVRNAEAIGTRLRLISSRSRRLRNDQNHGDILFDELFGPETRSPSSLWTLSHRLRSINIANIAAVLEKRSDRVYYIKEREIVTGYASVFNW